MTTKKSSRGAFAPEKAKQQQKHTQFLILADQNCTCIVPWQRSRPISALYFNNDQFRTLSHIPGRCRRRWGGNGRGPAAKSSRSPQQHNGTRWGRCGDPWGHGRTMMIIMIQRGLVHRFHLKNDPGPKTNSSLNGKNPTKKRQKNEKGNGKKNFEKIMQIFSGRFLFR